MTHKLKEGWWDKVIRLGLWICGYTEPKEVSVWAVMPASTNQSHSYTESLSPAIQRECGQPDGKVFVRILKSHNSGESNHRTPQTELS